VENALCGQCPMADQCEIGCPALSALTTICRNQDTAEKAALIRQYARDIGLIKFEIAPDLEELGNRILTAFPEFDLIKSRGVRIGYLKSFEKKRAKNKTVYAECRVIKGVYTAYLPFDFIITFYHSALYGMSENQKKILMLHELKHIGLNHKGYYLVPHDIEDFSDILTKYGLSWDALNADVPDILDI
jgi:hypothetical protein